MQTELETRTASNQAKRGANILMVNPKNLEVETGFNARIDYGDIGELKLSIKENGLKKPLYGYLKENGSDIFIITDGHRRHRAIMELITEGFPIQLIPLMREPKGYTDEQRTLDLIICNTGEPLKPIELTEVYSRLINFGWSIAKIAQKTGKSTSHVSQTLGYGTMPTPIQELVKEDRISAQSAQKIVKENKGDRNKQIEKVVEGIIKAEESGKSKATAKHLAPPKVESPLQLLTRISNEQCNKDNPKCDVIYKTILLLRGEITEAQFIIYINS